MSNTNFYKLLNMHPEESPYNNFYENAQQDTAYQKATILEEELNNQYYVF